MDSLSPSDQAPCLPGTINFRDAGGLLTADGRRVRNGLIYRSDDLSNLKKADHSLLSQMGLRLVVDLRTPAEQTRRPDRLPLGLTSMHLPIYLAWSNPTEVRRKMILGKVGNTEFAEDMTRSYRKIALECIEEFRTLFSLLQRAETVPMLIHCTGGKDRTGMAAALIQAALGVPQETIFEEYLRTNSRRETFFRRLSWVVFTLSLSRTSPKKIRQLMDARREYLEAFFESIDAHYGSLPNYFTQALKLSAADLAALKERFTEPI